MTTKEKKVVANAKSKSNGLKPSSSIDMNNNHNDVKSDTLMMTNGKTTNDHDDDDSNPKKGKENNGTHDNKETTIKLKEEEEETTTASIKMTVLVLSLWFFVAISSSRSIQHLHERHLLLYKQSQEEEASRLLSEKRQRGKFKLPQFKKPVKALVGNLWKRLRPNKRNHDQNQNQLDDYNCWNDVEYPNAYTNPMDETPTKEQRILMDQLGTKIKQQIPNFISRVQKVPWGASSPWWTPLSNGYLLLYPYLKIMKWPQNLVTGFPFKMCSKTKCPSYRAFEHSLKFREIYKPWMMSLSAIEANQNGFVYVYGSSYALPPSCRSTATTNNNNGHSLVWLRPVLYIPPNQDETNLAKKKHIHWIRAFIHTLEMAVSMGMKQQSSSNMTTTVSAKFNVILDASGFTFGMMTQIGMGPVKQMIIMLQDHFPNRLGIVGLANLSGPGQFILGLIKPLIAKEVRDKIYIIPSSIKERRIMLSQWIPQEVIPTYLGGTNTQHPTGGKGRIAVNKQKHYLTDQEAQEYLTSMSYHS